MEETNGRPGRILQVDLASGRTHEVPVATEDRRRYLGGKGLALHHLSRLLAPGVDPLAAENVLVLMAGLLTGTGAPCSSRFSAAAKSPLTGGVAASSCGGPFGMALVAAGYDGVILTGRAPRPSVVIIDGGGAHVEEAGALWGLGTQETQARLDLPRGAGALAIGPAGENRVRYAGIASDGRFLGRAGMGAVMGSKNVKAVVARDGSGRFEAADSAAFDAARRRARALIDANSFSSELYRKYGTDGHVMLSNRAGILPVRNFGGGSDPRAIQVAGETVAARYGSRPDACRTCTILCGHRGTYPNGVTRRLPEYEATALLGPNLGIFDPDLIGEWNELCAALGLDPMSAGGTLAYAMEAGERGLMRTALKFGSPEGIAETLRDIAYRRNQGDELAEGTRRLAERYGGSEFAIHVKGLEMSAYDPRGSWGQGLGFAVANRGADHLSSPIFSMEAYLGWLAATSVQAKAPWVIFFEDLLAALNSLGICLLTLYPFVLEAPLIKHTPAPLLALAMRALPGIAAEFIDLGLYTGLAAAATGIRLSGRELREVGERVHTLERWLNTREGISRQDDTLPQRMLEEARAHDPAGRPVPLERMLDSYYRARGYDPQGIPTGATLARLGINSTSA